MGTYYEILPETKVCRVYAIGVNIEDVNEDIRIQVTIDGIVKMMSFGTFTHSTTYYIRKTQDPIGRTSGYWWSITPIPASFVLNGKSVKIEVTKYTANGTGNLTSVCEYGVLKDV